MILRWLMYTFPRELRLGWQRLADDVFVWCALAAALTLLGYVELVIGADLAAHPGDPSPGVTAVRVGTACARTAAPPIVFVVAAVLFHSQDRGEPRAWRPVGNVVLRRSVPALLGWLAGSAAALLVSFVVQFAVIATLSELSGPADTLRIVSVVSRMFVFVGLLSRFAFVPFIVTLERRGPRQGQRRSVHEAARRLLWPLPDSWGRTRAVAFRLLPHMFLTIYAPIAAAYLPPTLRAPASFVMHVVSFTALAVLFDYYSDRSRVTS